jgi:hypothetical protein
VNRKSRAGKDTDGKRRTPPGSLCLPPDVVRFGSRRRFSIVGVIDLEVTRRRHPIRDPAQPSLADRENQSEEDQEVRYKGQRVDEQSFADGRR